MNAPLFKEIQDLSLSIVNASENNNGEHGTEAYSTLKKLCDENENSDFNHPLQWEALGDFSENHMDALTAYEKGLRCAEKLGLAEYTASIKFAMAECYREQNNGSKAYALANEARTIAETLHDDELLMAINELLNEVGNT